jgi:hypothetical protein
MTRHGIRSSSSRLREGTEIGPRVAPRRRRPARGWRARSRRCRSRPGSRCGCVRQAVHGFREPVGELDAPSYAWGVGQVLERFLHRVTDVQPQAIRGGGGSQPADDQSSPCNHSQT